MKKAFLFMSVLFGAMLLKAESVTIDNVNWNYEIENGTARLRRAYTLNEKVTVPSSFTKDGVTYPVVNIVNQAFIDNTSIKELTIPEGVQVLSIAAFWGARELEILNLPSTVIEIGAYAFSECPKLKWVKIHKDNPYFTAPIDASSGDVRTPYILNKDGTKICFALETCVDANGNAEIPAGIATVGKSSFRYIKNLKTLTIPNTVKTFESHSLSESGIESIEFPDSVETIGDATCYDCRSLKSVKFPASITRIEGLSFEYCPALASITLPASVEYVGERAFSHCHHSVFIFEGKPPKVHSSHSFGRLSEFTSHTAHGYYPKQYEEEWQAALTETAYGDKAFYALPMEAYELEIPEKYFLYPYVIGDGVVGGAGWYEPGETVTLTAFPTEGNTLCGYLKYPDYYIGDTSKDKHFDLTFEMPKHNLDVMVYFAPKALIDVYHKGHQLTTKEDGKEALLKSGEYFTPDSLKTFVLGTPEVKRVENGKVSVSVAVSALGEHNGESDWVEITRADDETTAFYKAVVTDGEEDAGEEDAGEEAPEEPTEDETEEASQIAA